ncbi:hypothetical protein ACKVWC_011594 [Pyricularia oryzae]
MDAPTSTPAAALEADVAVRHQALPPPPEAGLVPAHAPGAVLPLLFGEPELLEHQLHQDPVVLGAPLLAVRLDLDLGAIAALLLLLGLVHVVKVGPLKAERNDGRRDARALWRLWSCCHDQVFIVVVFRLALRRHIVVLVAATPLVGAAWWRRRRGALEDLSPARRLCVVHVCGAFAVRRCCRLARTQTQLKGRRRVCEWRAGELAVVVVAGAADECLLRDDLGRSGQEARGGGGEESLQATAGREEVVEAKPGRRWAAGW